MFTSALDSFVWDFEDPVSCEQLHRDNMMLKNTEQNLFNWRNIYVFGPVRLIPMAILVGVGAGIGAVFFRWLINSVQYLSFDVLGNFLGVISPFHLLIIPALGGLVYGPIIYLFAREAKGHGVPEVMEAVALRGGRIRPRVAVIKSLASAICIGTGGSVGREGPIVQIGSSLGSTVGQFFKLDDEQVSTLVACGAAGGIAATFNAPVAGAIFAMEIIAGQVQAASFGAMVISAVLADVVARLFSGDMRAFMVPDYLMVSSWELIFYAVLGVCAAVCSALFTTFLYSGEDLLEGVVLPEYIKPVIGGLCLGLIGLTTLNGGSMPHIFGVGYETIDLALGNKLLYTTALAFLAVKMLATVVTLSFGGSGGVFAPSLFMGAMLGEAFGIIVHHFFPGITAPPGAYSLVGMAAFFSGAAHAPITAILMLFEMTGNYHIILPLMLATVISNILSAFINPESIYIRKLTRRGVYLRPGHEIDLMMEITVAEAMTHDPLVVPATLTLGALADKFSHSHHHSFIVVDDDGLLLGVVSLRDLERAMVENSVPDNKQVGEIATTDDLLVAYPHESMGKALQVMGQKNIGRLPVIAHRGSREVIGVVRRHEIIQTYNKAILKRARGRRTRPQSCNDVEKNMRFAYIHINKNSPALNVRVKDLALPKEGLLVSVDHGGRLSVAHGDTVLRLGDRVTILANDDSLPVFRRQLQG